LLFALFRLRFAVCAFPFALFVRPLHFALCRFRCALCALPVALFFSQMVRFRVRHLGARKSDY
jgi:hypothetical protein